MALRATATLAATPPVISGVPTISGPAVEGNTLTATAAGVTGNPAPARTWQWYRGTTAISGATSASYSLTLDDVGAEIKVGQTETNIAGIDTAESSATSTVAAAGATATATIVAEDSPTISIAPAAYQFLAVPGTGFTTAGAAPGEVYNPQFHDIYYFWDFGESYTHTAPTEVFAQFKNSRYAYGPRASHVFRTPGPHTVSCLVVEAATGVSATATFQVTIATEAATFPQAAQTLILDSTGAGLAAYPSAAVYTTYAALVTALNDLTNTSNENTPRQIIVRRGQSFTAADVNLSRGGPWPTTVWRAADEAGARPIFNITGTQNWRDDSTLTGGGVKGIAYKGIDFRGPWDSTTETGTDIVAFTVNANKPPKQIVFDNCRFAGFEHVISHSGTSDPHAALYLNDTEVTDWRFYGIVPDEVRLLSLTGCAICQHVDANAGGTKQTSIGYFNNHSGCRMGKPIPLMIHSCVFYSRNDWARTPEGIWGQQPNLRYDTDGLGGGYCSVQASVWQGGNNVITFATEQSNPNGATNVLIEKNYFLGGHTTRKMVTLNKGGTTFRNNILVIPNTPKYDGYALVSAINSNWDTLNALNGASPQRFYNNTIINLNPSDDMAETETSGWSDLVIANNVFYQPNVAPVLTADGPLDDTQAFTPREKGYKHNISYGDGLHVLQAAYATPASSVWTGTPKAGSAAIGAAATGPVAYDDFWGVPRDDTLAGLTRTTPSRGAFEPALEA